MPGKEVSKKKPDNYYRTYAYRCPKGEIVQFRFPAQSIFLEIILLLYKIFKTFLSNKIVLNHYLRNLGVFFF